MRIRGFLLCGGGAKRKAISELGVTIDVAGSLNKERKVLVKSAPEPKSASSGALRPEPDRAGAPRRDI